MEMTVASKGREDEDMPRDASGIALAPAELNKAVELELHASDAFVTRVAERVRRFSRYRFALNLVPNAFTVWSVLGDAIEAPNYPLIIWACAACRCYGDDEFSQEHWMDPRLSQALGSNHKARNRLKRPIARTLMLPIGQCVVMVIILVYQTRNLSYTREDMCLYESVSFGPGAVGHDRHTITWFIVDIGVAISMYSISVAQTRLMTREWHAIAFVSSLHFTRGPNLALYAGAILDSLTATLFAVNLYFVIIASPQPLDVLFNATALNFVLELDNILAALSAHMHARAVHAIKKLGADEATFNDVALYLAAPPADWAPFGLHRMANVRLRDALVGVLRVMPVLMVVVHMYFYILLTTCNGLSYVWAPAASSPNASANASAVANTSHVALP